MERGEIKIYIYIYEDCYYCFICECFSSCHSFSVCLRYFPLLIIFLPSLSYITHLCKYMYYVLLNIFSFSILKFAFLWH